MASRPLLSCLSLPALLKAGLILSKKGDIELRTKYCCVLLLIAGLLCVSCSAEKKAKELYEIAAFEEVQFNTDHAKELYQEIIEKYPDTETARKARQALERLSRALEEKDIRGTQDNK